MNCGARHSGRLIDQSQNIRIFSDESGLPTKTERAQMSGFRKVKTNDELKKKAANGEKRSIIEMYRGKGIDVTSDS